MKFDRDLRAVKQFDNQDIVTTIDPTTARAIEDDKEMSNRVKVVFDNLAKTATDVFSDVKEETSPLTKNDYTKKLKLDESLNAEESLIIIKKDLIEMRRTIDSLLRTIESL